MSGIHEEHEKTTLSSKRIIFLFAFQIILFFILISRLFFLQVINFEKYKNLSDDNRIKTFTIPPMRGHIFDRNNFKLTENQKNYRVLLYQNKSNYMDILIKLSQILNLSSNEFDKMVKRFEKNKDRPIISILNNLNWEDLVKLEANSYSLTGIMIENSYMRYYPYNDLFSHIIGYVTNPTKEEIDKEKKAKMRELLLHPDYKLGRTGLERLFNKHITGKNGYKKLEMNALSIPIREMFLQNSTEGKDIKLTIDFKLQNFVSNRMNNVRGAVIVMNVKTGEILSLVSTPSYDSNKFTEGISTEYWNSLTNDPAKPLSNKAVSALYPPGSTFKLITAIAALESGWEPNKIIDCTGKIQLNKKRTLHCWRAGGHNKINIREAIQKSCNVYFARLGIYTGIENIYKYATEFGFGENFDIDLVNQKIGNIPNKEWKKRVLNDVWVSGDTVNVAIGQGFLSATPMELLVMTARIANNGYKVKPVILKNSHVIDDNKDLFNYEPLIKRENIKIIKDAMSDVVNQKGGTAYWTRIKESGFEMSGKTGTAQVIAKEKKDLLEEENAELETKFQNHGLFIAFAPSNDPKYAIIVVSEHGGGGSGAAAPIAKDILLYTQKHNIGYEESTNKKE